MTLFRSSLGRMEAQRSMPVGRKRFRHELNSFLTQCCYRQCFVRNAIVRSNHTDWQQDSSRLKQKIVHPFRPDAQLFVTFIFSICHRNDEWFFLELMKSAKQTSALQGTGVAWVHKFLSYEAWIMSKPQFHLACLEALSLEWKCQQRIVGLGTSECDVENFVLVQPETTLL